MKTAAKRAWGRQASSSSSSPLGPLTNKRRRGADADAADLKRALAASREQEQKEETRRRAESADYKRAVAESLKAERTIEQICPPRNTPCKYRNPVRSRERDWPCEEEA